MGGHGNFPRRRRRADLRLAVALSASCAAVVLAACGGDGSPTASSDCVPDPPPVVEDGLRTPDVRVSEDGVLETTLRASYGPVNLDDRTYETMNYEGSVPGPTLVVCPGDRLIVHLVNDLGDTPAVWAGGESDLHDVPHHEGQLTNLHTHGLHVSPKGNSDNVFLSVEPGEEFTYEYEIPEDHPPGMYWYHPHRHGFVEEQVYAGMLGVIYVQGGLDEVPELADVPTRTMVVNSLELGKGKIVPVQNSLTEKSPYFLNGELRPELEIAPGELQRWRILNGDDNAIFRLALDDHDLYVLANDGNTLERMSEDDVLLIGPGERREVLVQGGGEGSYRLRSLDFSQFQGGKVPASTIATLRSVGEPVDAELPEAPLTEQAEDLRDEQVDDRRRIVFSERQVGKNEFEFLINGKVFNPNRVDQTMRIDEVHEWTLVNQSTEWHTFHIHVNDFQVVAYRKGHVPNVSKGEVRDVSATEIDPEDTVKMPPGSAVKLRMKPTDFTGKFVFHCHMLFHEDRGMMAVVEVVE